MFVLDFKPVPPPTFSQQVLCSAYVPPIFGQTFKDDSEKGLEPCAT